MKSYINIIILKEHYTELIYEIHKNITNEDIPLQFIKSILNEDCSFMITDGINILGYCFLTNFFTNNISVWKKVIINKDITNLLNTTIEKFIHSNQDIH
jgi:hypothetical protein